MMQGTNQRSDDDAGPFLALEKTWTEDASGGPGPGKTGLGLTRSHLPEAIAIAGRGLRRQMQWIELPKDR